MKLKTFTTLSLVAFALLTSACAPKEFSAANEGELSLNSLGGGDGTGEGGEGELPATGGGGEGETETLPVIYPQITMKIPTCTSNQLCEVRVVLSRADAKAVSYKWQTNDTKYLSDPGRYAQPNVHYVPTGGTVLFNPGVTQRPMHIQTLSGFTQIDIPFLYGECTYDHKPVDCSVFKFVLTRM